MAETARRAPAHRSLRSRLLVGVLLPLAATWSIGSAVAFSLSWALAGRAFDRALLDDAYVIAASVTERDGALHVAALTGALFLDATLGGETVRVATMHGDGARPFAVVVAQTTRARTTLLL